MHSSDAAPLENKVKRALFKSMAADGNAESAPHKDRKSQPIGPGTRAKLKPRLLGQALGLGGNIRPRRTAAW